MTENENQDLMERRQFTRYPLKRHFGPFTADTPSFAILKNISYGGAYLRGGHLPLLGQKVTVTYHAGKPEELTLVGEVMRYDENDDRGFGIRFVKP
jgi:hypothetical protein